MQYNDYIRGASGSSIAERDALGRRVLVQGVEGLQIPPGGDLHLTLDSSIQHLAEKELEATITKNRAKAGVAIVVEPLRVKCSPWQIIPRSTQTILPKSPPKSVATAL